MLWFCSPLRLGICGSGPVLLQLHVRLLHELAVAALWGRFIRCQGTPAQGRSQKQSWTSWIPSIHELDWIGSAKKWTVVQLWPEMWFRKVSGINADWLYD